MKKLFAILLVSLLVPATALAQGGSAAAAADALFEQGRTALAKGDLDTACERFRASNDLDRAAGTLLNLAACEEKRGRVASAWEAFRGALEKLPATDSRSQLAKARIDALTARLPKLVLTLDPNAPEDTVVKESGVMFGSGLFGTPIPMDPGSHQFSVSAKGRTTRGYEVVLVEGKTATLVLTPEAVGTRSKLPTKVPEAPGTSYGPWPWVAGGVGVVGLAVGGITGGITLHEKSVFSAHCNEVKKTCDAQGKAAGNTGRVLGPVSTAGLVLGGVGIVTSATLFVLRPSKRVTVGVGPTSVLVGGAW